MPQLIKKKEKKVSARPPVRSKKTRKIVQRLPYIIASVVIVIALALVGVAYYQQYVAPFQNVVVTIDGTPTIKMRHFLERAKLAGSSGLSTLQNLTNEEVLKLSDAKYGISVTSQDIDNYLRSQAAGSDNATVTDAEFNEWYRQILNEKKVTGSIYREMVEAIVRDSKYRDYINTTIPSSIEHAHVYAIFTATYDEAVTAKERADGGENFQDLARELSIDESTRESGGELEWIPKGVYIYNNDPFSWEVGKASEVLAVMDSTSDSTTTEPTAYYVMMVSEIQVREISNDFLSEVQNRTYQNWLSDETQVHDVDWKYDSKVDAWISWQLSKSNPPATAASGG
jgi:foldase protein PrsA